MAAAAAPPALLRSRLAFMLSPESSPLRELRWWVENYGERDGLSRLTATLITALHLHIEEHAEAVVQSDLSKDFLEMLCLWFEHIICARQLLAKLPDTATWPETTAFCKQMIQNAIDSEPQRVCSRSFRAGDIVWNCKQCQKDTTCVLCQQCFRDSDHEGHDVYFYHVMTNAGGCCDCGDAGAWDPRGFCRRHGEAASARRDPDPCLWLPGDMASTSRIVIDQVVACISKLAAVGSADLVLEPIYHKMDAPHVLQSAEFNDEVKRLKERVSRASPGLHLRPRTESRDEMAVAILLLNWFGKVKRCITTSVAKGRSPGLALKEEVEPFVLTAITLQNMNKCMEIVHETRGYLHFHLVARNASSIRISLFTEHLAKWLLKSLCADSDAFSRITCYALTEGEPTCADETTDADRIGGTLVPLKRLIVQDLQLPDSCGKALRNLYIRLLVDSLFKQRFAIAFAKTYRECAFARVRRLPVLEMSDLDTIFGLSVQFLNRPNHVLLLVHDHGFLRSVLHSLYATVKHCQRPAMQAGRPPELDLLSTVLTQRKTKSLVTDLQYVLSTPGMSRFLFAEDPVYLDLWFDLLDTVYGMHEQRRKVSSPALADERWIPAFNLSLSLLSLFSDLTRYFMFGETLDVPPDGVEFVIAPGRTRRLKLTLKDPEQPHGEWCNRILSSCAERAAAILERRSSAARTTASRESLLGRHPYCPYDCATLPVTFHCLLQRFFASLMALCVTSTLNADDYGRLTKCGSTSFWLVMMRQPLNALIFFSMSNAGMWNYNVDVDSQAMNYQSLPFVSGMFMDMRVLQMASLTLPADVVVSYILHAFDMVDWLGLGIPPPDAQRRHVQSRARSNLQNIAEGQDEDGEEQTADQNPRGEASADASAPELPPAIPVSLEDRHVTELNPDEEHIRFGRSRSQSERLATSMIEVICVVVTELPHPTPFALKQLYKATSDKDPRLLSASERLLRREIVHSLAIKRSTYSMINDNCAHLKQLGVHVDASSIRKVLSEVAQEITRTDGMGPVQYDLKPEVWGEFDPLFHRLARTEKDQARERFLQNRVAPAISKPSFPGDTKPKAAAFRMAPLPATAWHEGIHPAFEAVRDRLLLCNASFLLVRHAFVKVACEGLPRRAAEAESTAAADSPAASSEAAMTKAPARSSSYGVLFLGNALHLFTLQIYHLRSKFGPDYGQDNTEGNGSAASPGQTGPAAGAASGASAAAGAMGSSEIDTGSVAWFVQKAMARDPWHGMSVLDCLLAFWYNEPRVDDTNRESVRWILSELCKMDPNALLRRVRKAYKLKKSALLAEKDKQSRKRKAQRNAMLSMRHSQELANRAFAKEMELESSQGSFPAPDATLPTAQALAGDPKKTKLEADEEDGEEDTNWGEATERLAPGAFRTGRRLSNAGFGAINRRRPSSNLAGGGLDPETVELDQVELDGEGELEAVASPSSLWIKNMMVERQFWRGPECVSCHERHRIEDGPTLFIGFRQRNNTIVRERAETNKHGWCVYWPEAAGRNCVLQLCGHAIHAKCLDQYKSSFQTLPSDNRLEPEKNEFLCPLCKTLSNFEIPCVPPSLVYGPRGSGTLALGADDEGRLTFSVLDQTAMWFAQYSSLTTASAGASATAAGKPALKAWAAVQGGSSASTVSSGSASVLTDGGTGHDVVQSDLVEVSGKHLEPLADSLRLMGITNKSLGKFPFSPKFTYHSEEGRLRELQTMVMLDHRETPQHKFSEDALAVVFSLALTIVSEREIACIGTRPKASVLSANAHKRLRRLFEACRAYLLVDSGSGLNYLTSEMFEFFSHKRSLGHHCVLHQSPEMLLILSALRDSSRTNVRQTIRSMYVMKLVQALLEISIEDIDEAAAQGEDLRSTDHPDAASAALAMREDIDESPPNLGFGLDDGAFLAGCEQDEPSVQPPTCVFDGTLELREALLDKFRDVEIQPRDLAVQDGSRGLVNALVDSLLGFVHIAQIVLAISEQSHVSSELALVSAQNARAFLQDVLQLPAPSEILQHERLMDVIFNWIDQVIVCMPSWMPRALSTSVDATDVASSSLAASSSSSSSSSSASSNMASPKSLTAPPPTPTAGATRQLAVLARPGNLRPLSIRPLVKLRDSYTEQYVEVHKEDGSDTGEPVHDRAICLICGEILFAGKKPHPGGPRNVDQGGCTRHTEEYHNGIGVLLLFRRSSSVLLINGPFSAYYGSLYADRNGDDQQVTPSLPMYLDQQRFLRVYKLWAENSIPSQVSSLRNSASVVIRRSYY